MKFKVGDRVKFLNEKGGGIISRVVNPQLVHVSIEDGFDIPVVPGDLVLDEEKDKYVRKEENSTRIEQRDYHKPAVQTEFDDDRKSTLDKISFRGTIADGVYLAFVPHDQKWLITGQIDIMLVNNTGYDLLFSFFLRSAGKKFQGIDFDQLTPRSKILIETIERENLEKWTTGVVQILFFREENESLFLPGNCEFDIKPSRIYKEGNFRESALLREKAFIFCLLEAGTHKLYQGTELEKKDDETNSSLKVVKPKRAEAFIDRHRTSPGEAVVDLHIGELIDNITGLTSSDMLKIQRDYFIKALESAIANDYERVTFIHGVGNGVLKNSIIELMKDYEGLENKAASIAKFGVGAIDVLIKRK